MEHHYESHRLEWNGLVIEVRYCRSWSRAYEATYDYPLAHIEVRSTVPLPITETGYRSHFTSVDEIEAAGGAVAFILSALDEAAKDAAWIKREEASRQMALF